MAMGSLSFFFFFSSFFFFFFFFGGGGGGEGCGNLIFSYKKMLFSLSRDDTFTNHTFDLHVLCILFTLIMHLFTTNMLKMYVLCIHTCSIYVRRYLSEWRTKTKPHNPVHMRPALSAMAKRCIPCLRKPGESCVWVPPSWPCCSLVDSL